MDFLIVEGVDEERVLFGQEGKTVFVKPNFEIVGVLFGGWKVVNLMG